MVYIMNVCIARFDSYQNIYVGTMESHRSGSAHANNTTTRAQRYRMKVIEVLLISPVIIMEMIVKNDSKGVHNEDITL